MYKMTGVKVRFRTETGNEMWWCLLLPLDLLLNFFIVPSEINYLIFVLSSCLLIIVFENRFCSHSCDIFPPSLVKISHLAISFSFAVNLLIKGSSYNIFYLFAVAYLSSWLFHYILYSLLTKCPKSFTFGEAIIATQGITLTIGGYVLSWYIKIFGSRDNIHDISEINKFLQILFFGGLLLILTLHLMKSLRTTFTFYCTCLVLGSFMYLCWFYTLQNDPFLWVFKVCLENRKRTLLMFFWVIFTATCILFVFVQNATGKQKVSTGARKYFHVIINLIYLPGILFDPELLHLTSAVIFAVFVLLEIIRALKVPPLGLPLQNAFQVFLDEKDSGPLILTHIYLLVGCSCPLWLYASKYNNTNFQISFASGLLSVGVGDTVAAVIGSHFGKHKWPNSAKSLEGTFAAIITQMLIGIPLLLLGQAMNLRNFIILLLSIFTTSFLEAKTVQVDNLILPLVMYPFLCLCSCN